MKLYISIPISGRPIEEAKCHAENIKATLTPYGHECRTPCDVCPDTDKSYAYYLGREIEALLSEDVEGIVMGDGYYKSKGCRLEEAAAIIYGKHIVYECNFYATDFQTLTTSYL